MQVIQATIDRFEDNKVVLRTDDSHDIIWPKSHLKEGLKEGDRVTLTISNNAKASEVKEKLAKDMLNNILKSSL